MKEYVWPITRIQLEDYYDLMLNCAKCKYCQTVFPLSATLDERFAGQCPSGEFWRFESYYASGRLELARGILEGSLDWSEKAREILYSCSLCGACEENCRTTQRLTPFKIIRRMRERYVREGHPLLEAHQKIVQSMHKNHNPYGITGARKSALAPARSAKKGKQEPKADVLVFGGCTLRCQVPDRGLKVAKVLDLLKMRYTTLGEAEHCCGAPLFHLGLIDEGRKQLQQAVKAIAAKGVRKAVFVDPLCYATFKKHALFDLPEPPFQMEHLTEFLLPVLKEKRSLLRPVRKTVVYQDSAFLARHQRVYEEPREILRLIPGIELKEFFRNRLNTYCPGSEPMAKAAYPDMARAAALARLAEAQAVGAQCVVASDPHEFLSFQECGHPGVEIKGLWQLVAESMEGVK